MSDDHRGVERLPASAWVPPVAACALLTAKLTGLLPGSSFPVLIAAALLLAGAVFAAVHHAEVIALRVGEPFGTLVLALAVTVIEGSLIVSMMLSGGAASIALARDTVFATVMIICNGVLGACLFAGSLRHHVVSFRTEGTTPAVAVLATLATLTLVLPRFTLASEGPTFSVSQLVFAGVASLILYGVFVFVQTVRHRDYFLPEGGDAEDAHAAPPTARTTLVSLVLLVISLVAVVGLAKVLSPTIEGAVGAAGMPNAVVGIVIAMMVLLPETLSAVRAAKRGRLQTSMNLAFGSALATIGLTIPAVVVTSIVLNLPLVLGLPPTEMVLLALTLLLTSMTVASGRATVLQGVVHLVVFAVFLFLAMVP
jgi:Ca2+:H+ antiporter